MFGRVGSTLNGGAHACVLRNVRLCQDRSARLSSLTHGECHLEISSMLSPLVCSQSAIEIGVI